VRRNAKKKKEDHDEIAKSISLIKKSPFIFILSFSMLIFTLPISTFAQSNDNVISGANYIVSSTQQEVTSIPVH
jgi:hypothetical protein